MEQHNDNPWELNVARRDFKAMHLVLYYHGVGSLMECPTHGLNLGLQDHIDGQCELEGRLRG